MGYRVLALISGGKDSCFAMMSSVAAGHEIVALANLRPKDESVRELDSYMYQTVGHEAIQLYAEAMELPLFRGLIKRSSVSLGADYTPNADDEVEDLYDLIVAARAKVHFDAVCNGAILSDYQRVRVENVCSRLSLVSLAYLWRRDQSTLLQEMIDCGVEAVIIKCAALGLEELHLGKTLAQLKPRLEDLKSRYGINVCGEGGEYESFTLDCPLFYKSIKLDDTEVILHSDDAIAPVKLLRLKGLSLKDKKLPKFSSQSEMLNCVKMRTPLDFIDGEVLASGNSASLPPPASTQDQVCAKPSPSSVSGQQHQQAAVPPSVRVVGAINGRWFSFSGFGFGGKNSPARQATQMAFEELKDRLSDKGLDLGGVASITVALRDMSDYAAVNGEYIKNFSAPNPPSRACVESKDALSLVTLSGIGFAAGLDEDDAARLIEQRGGDGGGGRSTMHVQSISHWAPANIGPYSQAVKVNGTVHLAGQIGLVPGTMEMVEGGAEAEARLALRHAFRALEAVGTSAQEIVQAICFVTNCSHVVAASHVWREALQHSSGDNDASEERLKFCWVEVSDLPRGALVEWQISAGLPLTVDSDGESGGGDDDKYDYKKVEVEEGGEEDVISELRYEKSFGLLLGGRRPQFAQRRKAGDLEFFAASFRAARLEGDKSLGDADLVFPEATGMTLMSVQTFVSPASKRKVASSSTIFPANRFGVEGRSGEEEKEEEILVIGCARRYKMLNYRIPGFQLFGSRHAIVRGQPAPPIVRKSRKSKKFFK